MRPVGVGELHIGHHPRRKADAGALLRFVHHHHQALAGGVEKAALVEEAALFGGVQRRVALLFAQREAVALCELGDFVLEMVRLNVAQGAPVAAPPPHGLDAAAQCGHRRVLGIQIEGGPDLEPGLLHALVRAFPAGVADARPPADALVFAEPLGEPPPHLFGEVARHRLIGREGPALRVALQHRPRRQRGFKLLVAFDEVLFAHAPQHKAAPRLGGLRVAEGRVVVGPLRQPRQQRRLAQRQIGHTLFAEVNACRFAHAVNSADAVIGPAEVDVVQVDVENLALAEFFLDARGQHNFLQLADVGFFARNEELLHRLHGDGAGALHLFAPGQRHGQRGAQHGDGVHPLVLPEARVLGGQKGQHHAARNLIRRLALRLGGAAGGFGPGGAAFGGLIGQRHQPAALGVQLANYAPVPGEDRGGELHIAVVIGEGFDLRQTALHHQLPRAVSRPGQKRRQHHQPGDEPQQAEHSSRHTHPSPTPRAAQRSQ